MGCEQFLEGLKGRLEQAEYKNKLAEERLIGSIHLSETERASNKEK